jgi:hypothetical protein
MALATFSHPLRAEPVSWTASSSPSLAARFLVSSKGLTRPPRKGKSMFLLSQ